MSNIPVYAGLDYHQDAIQVCVLDTEGNELSNRSVPNDAKAVELAITRCGQPQRIAIEACCGAADLAEELVIRRGLSIELAHPGYVNRMKRSPDKTDYSDAQLLADLTRVNYLPTVWLAPEGTRELRRLVRHRAQLVERRKECKLRIRGLLRENRLRCPYAQAWTKRWYEWLKYEADLSENDRWILDDHFEELLAISIRINKVEARLEIQIANDPIVARLMDLDGVGLVTAITLRAEIGRFDRFSTGKQLSRFCGVTPRNASSGARQADSGLIKAGNPELRHVLIELAHRLIYRIKGRWARLAESMAMRGKPNNVIVAAVANRWVRWLFHEMKTITVDN